MLLLTAQKRQCKQFLDKYAVTVQGGYYYRVTLTHYAKEQTWFFPDEQSVTNTSSYVWVA